MYDTFTWHTQHTVFPIGSSVFTDGSLLDNAFPDGWQAVGWAFAVLDDNGTLIAVAYGVPPKWVDTIQGAELWAVSMAVDHVITPSRVWSDCDSIRLGLSRPASWAGSSKRRYARIWSVLKSKTDDAPECVGWMPAHMSESAVGQKRCSTGDYVSHDMWCANQICDHLAKLAAESVRVDRGVRAQWDRRRTELKELLYFLGQITYAANHFPMPDGEIARDSTAKQDMRKRLRRRVLDKTRSSRGRVRPKLEVTKSARDWRHDFVAKHPKRGDWGPSVRHTQTERPQCLKRQRNVKSRALQKQHEYRNEVIFQSWWRERCDQTVASPGVGALSGKERLNALRERVLAKLSYGDTSTSTGT